MPISKEEYAIREKRMMEKAFELFVQKSIEAVSMQDIAKAADVGVASVFRHYQNKANLVAAVSGYKWGQYLKDIEENRPLEKIKKIPAIDRLTFTLDRYIDLYKNHRDLLRFNDNFNHYITKEGARSGIELDNYFTAVNPIRERFHLIYEKAQEDKTVRTDVDEDKLLRLTVHTMMSACHHYAGGFIWGARDEEDPDYTEDLLLLKKMILEYATGNSTERSKL